jgi:membrane protease YdiL (CAAX protease family)
MPRSRKPSNYSLLFPYVLPYFAYVLSLMLPETLAPKPWAYGLATAAAALAIGHAWRWYVPLRGPGSLSGSLAAGVASGVAGTVLWVAIKRPSLLALESWFGAELPSGEPWEPAAFWMRVLASSTVVAVFEEMLFRGLLLRGAVTWDRLRRAGAQEPLAEALHDHGPAEVEPGAWTPFALLFSSLAFAAGHQPGEWPAAAAYGLLMAGLWVWRKDLLSCVVAHGVTNLTLALWVQRSGQWEVW